MKIALALIIFTLTLAATLWWTLGNPATQMVVDSNPIPDIPLEKRSGKVLNHLGRGLPGVEINATALPHAIRGKSQTVTHTGGQFELDLPTDYPGWISLTKQGYQTRKFELLPGDQAVEITLFPGGLLRGRVLDPFGRALEYHHVDIAGQQGFSERLISDRQGLFESFPPPGRVIVSVHSDRYADKQFIDVEVQLNQTSSYDFKLERGVSITYRVLDPEGLPLPGTSIIATTTSGDFTQAVTNSDGHATLAGLAVGIVKIQLIHPGFQERKEELELLNDRPMQSIGLQTAEEWTLILTDENGQHLEQASIHLYYQQQLLAKSSNNNISELQILKPNRTYSLEVCAPGLAPIRQRFRYSQLPQQTLKIELHHGGRFTGLVLDQLGKPAEQAQLLISRKESGAHALGVDAFGSIRRDGRFSSPLLRPGTYLLEFRHPDLGRATVSAAIGSGQELQLDDIYLEFD